MKLRQPGYDGLVVSVAAVAMQLHKIREQQPDEIERIRPLRMAGNLRALPWTQMVIEFAPQLRHFLPDAFELRISIRRSCKMTQFFDVFFQPVDLPLAAPVCRNLVFGCHYITSSTV